MTSTAKSKHESDELNLEDRHHRARKTTEGGRCLVPYGAYSPQSCSYRWQAYQQALDEKDVYNWNRYESLVTGAPLMLVRRRKSEKGERRWELAEATAPERGAWDISDAVSSSNFKNSCNTPYWFEAHHIIPHSELKNAVAGVGKGKPDQNELQLMVRRGLMEEGYNLNHKHNMFILPMDRHVAKALELPMHLAAPDLWNHPEYSSYVEQELQTFFDPVKRTISGHEEKIEYNPVRKKLENFSRRLRDRIKTQGRRLWAKQESVALDDIKPKVNVGDVHV
ncbi:hypothetical protein HPC49_01950 [Pyxidicoccus fallax]|uniref:Uncharacterized protein n=1 Tax=Pyxidicoccus fallax TaxID=394095 RepID=A0A848LEB8_9BACT|nr:AHH domain-containing protein [Pyxidicoccus fallax]NMO13798.1 hypothetical protein [Pyxidicoccus fallax]NPC77015.1 hypothetical protein [Pyxidicoccus fallax]